MSDDAPTNHSATAKRIAAFLAAVIVLNVLLRVVPLPDVDLPSISIGRPPDWLHALLKAKNWLLLGIFAVIVIGAAIDQWAKDKDKDTAENDAEAER